MKTLSNKFFEEILKEKNIITIKEYPQRDTDYTFYLVIQTENVIVRIEGEINFYFDVWEREDYEVDKIYITTAKCKDEAGEAYNLIEKQLDLLKADLDFQY